MPFIFLYLTLIILTPNAQATQTGIGPVAQHKASILWQQAQANITNGCFLLEVGPDQLISYNSTQMFTPASIWKLATAATALFVLGKDYRFKTEFYSDKKGGLYIKGYGDPFLVSEEIDLIAKELRQKLTQPITAVYIDQSAFSLPPLAPSWQNDSDNPYDAKNYATAVNFNTINVSISPGGIRRSAEKQTPTLAIMRRLTKHLSSGKHRINISQKKGDVNSYISELFLAKIIPDRHNAISHQMFEKTTPATASLLYRHFSTKKLPEIIKDMLLYSNNFIANQLFLTCGATRFGFPANWQKARKLEQDFLEQQIGLDKSEFILSEGSGLARSNKITGKAMLAIIKYFRANINLLPKKKNSWIKSGTLTGVYSYAGYLKGNNKANPFVIILNQKSNTRNNILDIMLAYEQLNK